MRIAEGGVVVIFYKYKPIFIFTLFEILLLTLVANSRPNRLDQTV